jgi:hypothetical protein
MEQTLNPSRPVFTPARRAWLCRLVFACILVSLLYSFFSRTMIHQWCGPSLRYPYVDPTYWLLLLSGIPSFLSGHYVAALVFDLALFASCLLVLIFPGRRLFVIIFFLLYGIYFLTINLYGNWHTSGKAGVLLAPIPFMVRDTVRFGLLWEGLRYFTLFVYADGFLWKLFRGTWLHSQQGVLIIRENLAPYLYYHPGTAQAQLYYWFLQHPAVTGWLFKAGWITEGLFLIGFFTRRFDRGLLLASLLLPIGFFFFADAFFFELYILSLTLVSWEKVFARPYFAGRLR